MTAPQLVVIADDLTGAADTAGAFATSDLSVILSLSGTEIPAADVLSLSTDCRDAGAGDVRQRVLATLERARSQGEPDHWFQKIDSALRGHPGAEIPLILQEINKSIAVCVPALPDQGRTVRDGSILVNGEPLHKTSLGAEKQTSSIHSIIADVAAIEYVEVGLATLRAGADFLAGYAPARNPLLIIVDAETDDDLDRIAMQLIRRPDVLPVGSAGLGAAIAAGLGLSSHIAPNLPRDAWRGPVLAVVGSAHDASARQVETARENGMSVVRPAQIDARWNANEVNALRDALEKQLRTGKDTILTTSGMPLSSLDGQVLADQLAWVAAGPILAGICGGLVLTGGDIAAAVCSQIDGDYLHIQGEVSPAIPWGILGGGPCSGMPVVTKAGSFGGPEALLAASAQIRLHNSDS